MRLNFYCVPLVFLLVAICVPASADPLKLNFRTRLEIGEASGLYNAVTEQKEWNPAKTAIVICDMWDDHYCRNAARRVGEMAPRMNEVIKKARSQGVLIIHSPSGCMDQYKDSPQRKLAQDAPVVETKEPLESWCYLDSEKEALMPVKVDQPCDDEGELRERKRFYTKQIDTLEIEEGDAITDSAEAYYLMKQRGITNLIVMGVHTNMCVLGRPFGIRQMVGQGINVALMRDMTDTMYNPSEEPYVNHFTGNDLVFEHIEKYWCPTVTSGDILGDGVEFRFPGDKRKHVVIVMAEKEYKTRYSLPKFAIEELGGDFKITNVFGEDGANSLPGVEVVKDADLVLLSVRRRNLPKEQLDLFRKHIADGKPLVGIRTASHAFLQRKEGEIADGGDEWRDFDPSVLGGNYHGHHSREMTSFAQVNSAESGHPILTGVESRKFQVFGGLYEVRPLEEGTTVLLNGTARGVGEGEPVAWTHTGPGGGKVFYTSQGHAYDFNTTDFVKILRNAVYWALDLPIPEEDEQDDSC